MIVAPLSLSLYVLTWEKSVFYSYFGRKCVQYFRERMCINDEGAHGNFEINWKKILYSRVIFYQSPYVSTNFGAYPNVSTTITTHHNQQSSQITLTEQGSKGKWWFALVIPNWNPKPTSEFQFHNQTLSFYAHPNQNAHTHLTNLPKLIFHTSQNLFQFQFHPPSPSSVCDRRAPYQEIPSSESSSRWKSY